MRSSLRKDRRLLSRCLSGDRRACEKFVRTYSDLVYRSIQHILTVKHISFTQSDLEDLHNTVFLKFFENNCKKLRQYRRENGCGLATWIRIVTVRLVINHIRKKGLDSMVGQQKRVALEDVSELKADDMEAWTALEKSEQQRLLQEGIRNLSPRDRLFFKLHYERGFSIKEVARAMRLSVDNAYSVKHRAIQRLKARIERDGERV